MTSATADCLESLVGALELTGNVAEAERLVDVVLLDRLDKVTSRLEGRRISEWDLVLNERARMMEERFRERVLETLSPGS